jgi:hypothetical protein
MTEETEAEASRNGAVVRLPSGSIALESPARRSSAQPNPAQAASAQVSFDRRELTEILSLYGRMVASGEWRDYALDFGPQRAVFSVFRRASETPLYRIVKEPRAARRQGAYSVLAASGLVLKRGAELSRVLAVITPKARLALV